MQSAKVISRILLIILVSTTWFGCRDELPTEDPLLAEDDFFPGIETVDPSNNSSGVNPSSSYGIKFSEPMDTASVSGNLYVAGGPAVHEWLDSLAEHCGTGGTGGSGKQHLMGWLDSMGCDGHLLWNDRCDSCVFVPDSVLKSNTIHIVYLTGDVLTERGAALLMDELEYDGYLFFFSTSK